MESLDRRKAVLALLASRLGALALQFFAVRVYVRELGEEGYAIPVFFLLLTGYVLYSDFGFSVAMQREILELRAQNRHSEIRSAAAKSIRLIAIASGLSVIVYAALFLALCLPFDSLSPQSRLILFGLGAGHCLGMMWQSFAICGLAGLEEFGAMSLTTATLGWLTPILGAAFVTIWGTPESVLVATASSALLSGGLGVMSFHRKLRVYPIRPGRATYADFVGVGARSGTTRFANQVAGNVDKAIIPYFSPALLSRYQVCWVFVQAVFETVQPVYQVLFAKISKAVSARSESSTDEVERCFLLSAWVGASVIIVGSGLTAVVVPMWTGLSFPGLAGIGVALGVYKASEYVTNCIGVTFFAQGRMDRLLPFALANALLTAALTGLSVSWFGLIGVAIQNAGVAILIAVPLVFAVRRHVFPELRVGVLLCRFAAMLVIGSGFAYALTFFVGVALGWVVIAAPLAIGCCALLLSPIAKVDPRVLLRRRS